MMNRALKLLSWEVRGLQAAVYILAVSSLLSSILALLRDRLLAHTFGAGSMLDIYYASFRVPDLIFVGTGALVSVYVLIPELARRSEESQRDYIDTVVAGFSLLAVVVSSIAAFLAPAILNALFPEFVTKGLMEPLIELTRILLLQPIFLGLSNVLAALTQSRHRYALYSISPLLYNAGIILGVLLFYPMWGPAGLAVGVVVGAFMHFAIQLPSALSDGFLRRLPQLREPHALLRTIWISLPRSLALSMNQVAFLGLTALAATLASGSVAIFMLAYNLQAVPLAIIGASYSVAAFPTLAASFARGERTLFVEHIATAARYVFFWSLPAAALIIVLRAHIVRFILGTGKFDWTDTRLTAAALAIFTISLAAQSLTLLIIRGYYAAGRTFTPFFVALASAGAMTGLGSIFVGAHDSDFMLPVATALLRVVDVPGSSVLALAFAYALISIISAIALVLHFEHRFRGFLAKVWRAWLESAVAAAAAGVAAYIVLAFVGPVTFASTTASVLTRASLAGSFGIVVAAFVYFLLGSREFRETGIALRSRFSGITAPKPPDTVVVTTEEAITTAGQ